MSGATLTSTRRLPVHPSDTLTFQIFYGISSPWAYFGAPRAAKIAAEAGIPIILRPIRIIEANGGIHAPASTSALPQH
jgi:2-hydroxychromene-2-carboxylate isomerase